MLQKHFAIPHHAYFYMHSSFTTVFVCIAVICLVFTCVWWNCCDSLSFSSSLGTWFTSKFRWQCLEMCLHHLFEDGCCSVQNSSCQLTKESNCKNWIKKHQRIDLSKGCRDVEFYDFPSKISSKKEIATVYCLHTTPLIVVQYQHLRMYIQIITE